MEKIKDMVLRWWFVLSSLALTIIYILYQRRGQKLEEAYAEVQKHKLAMELEKIREKAKGSTDEYKKAMDDYQSLKRRHAELFAKYSQGAGAPEPK